jgi:hypothetical protein
MRREPGGNLEGEALGRSQGGFSTKVHLRAEGGGKLITLVLTPGQRHEAPIFPQLMAQGQTQAEAALGSGRQGLQQPGHPPLCLPAWDQDHHPAQSQRVPEGAF